MEKVGEQLPAVSTALGALVLVFLGLILTAWESYKPDARPAVRSKFRRRAWMTFFSLLAAVLSAVFGLVGIGTDHRCSWPDYCGVILFAISIFLMLAVAFISILEIE